MSFLASFHQMLSVMVHGEKLTTLVARAKVGDDNALVKAVQIDKRILAGIPHVRERFERASAEGERDFLDALSYRLQCAPYRGKIRHKPLWSCDELKELGGWKSREMVDRYAKYATEHLAVAATRIERVRAENVGNIVTFTSRSPMRKDLAARPGP
jgi:hypothetical protein